MAEELAERMQRLLTEGMAEVHRDLEDGSIEVTFRDVPPLVIEKVAAWVPISTEMAMDLGLIPDTRPPRRYSRRTRFRWWLDEQRERIAYKVFRLIAGHNLPEPPDDY